MRVHGELPGHFLRHRPGIPNAHAHRALDVVQRTGIKMVKVGLVVFCVAYHPAFMIDATDLAPQFLHVNAVTEPIHGLAFLPRPGNVNRFELHEQSSKHSTAFRVEG
jgi:hypothetical protein